MSPVSVLARTGGSPKEWHKAASWCPGIGKGELVQIEAATGMAQEMRTAYPTHYPS
jgi:hypothetical protein